MDYKPRQSYKGSSYTYKKKRIFWFNSAFNDDFTVVDGKIDDITFNVPPFQTYKNNNLKLLTFVREDANTKPIIIKLKEPYLTSRSVINTDKENYPIIYANHTGVEGMTSKGNNFDLTPQQIPKFVFKFDENFTPILSASTGVVISQTFTYTGTIQTFNIPSGVSSVNIYCWGAGGGNSLCTQTAGSYIGSRGGNGGFVKATLAIPSGTTSLAVIVGQGGRKGVSNSLSGKAFGGGGDGIAGNSDWYVGGGGGFSGVFVNDANMTIISSYQVNTSATPFIIAGAGGGGGGADSSASSYISATHGGNGGTDNGNDSSGSTIGGGGTQTTGGTGTVGNEGAKYRGGNGDNFSAGGGSGWYGGGTRDTPGGLVGGGGGGSSYINSSYTIRNITNLKTTSNGTATAPANTENYYQSGIAVGAPTTTTIGGLANGGNGLVVIEYFVKRNDGITANETLVQATNSSITVVENSKYLINYQNPINIPTGTYETIFSNGGITFKSKPDYTYPTTSKSPIIWYKFDGSQFLYDSSGNNNLTTTGAVLDTNNFIRGNGSLSVSQNKVAKISGSNINLYSIQTSNGLSFSVWFRATSASQYGRVFEFMNNAPPENYSVIMDFPNSPTTNNLRIYTFNTPTYVNYTTSGINFCDGNWRHIVWTISSSGVWSFYINGVNQNINITGNVANSLDLNYNRVLGGSFDGSVSYITGNIDDFRIFDYVLSPNEVYDLYNGNADRSYPILKDANGETINPLAWYKFDVSTTGLVVDASGNGRTLTASTSSPTFDNISFIKGNGSALFVSANNQYFSMPRLNYNAINIANGISFSFWCRLTNSTDNNGSIVEFSSYGVSNANILIMRSGLTNNLKFYSEGGTLVDITTSGINFFDGTWRHIVWTVSKTGFWTIYSNATSILTNTGKILPAFTSATNVDYIGSRSDGATGIDGNLDDVRIYQQELSATQVSELYNGRVSIYNPPNFEIGLEMNDVDLVPDNTISPYL